MYHYLNPCPTCGRPRQQPAPDISAMLADGRLVIEPEVSYHVAQQIVADFQTGRWGRTTEPFTSYEAMGRYLLAVYEVADAVYHVLSDHGHTLTEIIKWD